MSGPSGTPIPAISRVCDASRLTNVFAGATVSCMSLTASLFIAASSALRCFRFGRFESLGELESFLGDLTPARVDCKRVPTARHLDDFGHALVALLLFVGRVGNRPGNRMIRVGRDDQHWTRSGFVELTFASDHGLKFADAAWKRGSPAPGTESSPTAFAKP